MGCPRAMVYSLTGNISLINHIDHCTVLYMHTLCSCCFLDDTFSRLGLETWITIVPGTLLEIDRQRQTIRIGLSNGEREESLIHYDYLVLGTGTQYCIEEPQVIEIIIINSCKRTMHVHVCMYIYVGGYW